MWYAARVLREQRAEHLALAALEVSRARGLAYSC